MRRGIAPGNVDAIPMLAVLFPFHGDAVSRVLRRETEGGGQRSRADRLQANETDARDSHAMDEFWSKWARQEPLEIGGLDAIIHEETPINGAFEARNIHAPPLSLRITARENATADDFSPYMRVKLMSGWESHAAALH